MPRVSVAVPSDTMHHIGLIVHLFKRRYTSVALEAMYGPLDGGEVTSKISRRAVWLLGRSENERRAISKEVKSFYRTRSKVVHGTISKDEQKRRQEVSDALASGKDLASRSLFALLDRGPINSEVEWNALIPDDPENARE